MYAKYSVADHFSIAVY